MNSPFIVQDILRSNEIHLISGPAGAGKTSLLLHLAAEWHAGQDILGHASCPGPAAIVSCDRSLQALEASMERIGCPLALPHLSLRECRYREADGLTFPLALDAVLQRTHGQPPRCIFLDGLHTLCPGRVTENRDVVNFLTDTAKLLASRRITLIASTYSPKSREGEAYEAILDNVLGARAWTALTDTKIFIQYASASNPSDPRRRVWLFPPDLPAKQSIWQFDDAGRLQYLGDGDTISQSEKLDEWLSKQEPESIVTTAQIHLIGSMLGLSRATTTRWITDQCSLGTLVKVERGEYKVTGSSTST